MVKSGEALALLLCIAAIPPGHAQDFFRNAPVETGVSVGRGDNFHTALRGGNAPGDVTFLSLMYSRGKIFRELDRGRSLQLTFEGSVSHADQDGMSRRAAGFTPLFVYNFEPGAKITAFAEAGLGLLYTDLNPEHFGSHINFTLNAGIGFRYALAEQRFLRLSYRLHHISNGGLDDANRSIDSNFLIFGVSFRR